MDAAGLNKPVGISSNLSEALQSDEKWTGNKIKRRKRISFGLALAITIVAIITGIALAPELRAVFRSPQVRARN